MVKEAPSKINRVGPRHTVYLQKDLVEDTAFPFRLNEPLTVRVEGETLIIERAKGRMHVGSDFIVGESEGANVISVLDNLGFSPLLSKAEKIYEMLKEVHEAETMELRVRLMPPREHAILLFRDVEFLEKVLNEFFDPGTTANAPRGLLSEKSWRLGGVKNLLYNQMQEAEKGRVSERLLHWVSELAASNSSSEATRVAIEDWSWFLDNDLEDEVEKWETTVGKGLGNVTVLCCYNLSMLTASQIGELVGLHSYVVLDWPLRVYHKG